MHKVLVTGTAGFIGFHTALKLLNEGYCVTGIDNINDYYDVNLKYGRLDESGIKKEKIQQNKSVQSTRFDKYDFYQMNLADTESIDQLFKRHKFDYVIHLAAQAGVRYSLENPHTYIDSNIKGFLNILEACRNYQPKHLLYASSSSVYGANTKIPFSENDNVDHPVSLYAATKKSNELMAHTYSHLFNIPTTGLRFFTVYGPWGRPDMAIFLFTKAIKEGKPVKVFNRGEMMRDFTYIDDVVEGIYKLLLQPAMPHPAFNTEQPEPSVSMAPYSIYNIGNSGPELLMNFIAAIESALGKKAIQKLMPMQPGDVTRTWADTSSLENRVDYKPSTPISTGVKRFVEWYERFYGS